MSKTQSQLDRKLIIGTRGSKLAMWQANYIKDKLVALGYQADLKVIKTQGDIIQHLRFDKIEGKGFFTKELEESLFRKEIDLAVHSHKDLPTVNPEGLIIAAVTEREDPAELLIVHKDCIDLSKKLMLKHNATVGTSSNRRKAQLAGLRPDLEFADLRGNIQTRLQKLRDEQYDAIVLAKAGVVRVEMDLSDFHVIEISPLEVIPAPAQGALAIQIREDDTQLKEVLSNIHEAEVSDNIGIERKILNLFDAGCHAPLGSYCIKTHDHYECWTSVADTADDFPQRLYIKEQDADVLVEKVFNAFKTERKFPERVFISREIDEHSYFGRAMDDLKIQLDARSLINIFPIVKKLDSYILKHVDWIFFNSKNAIEHFFALEPILSKKTKFGVVGSGSADKLKQFGKEPDYSGEAFGIQMDEIAMEFAAIVSGKTVLFPRAKDSLLSMQKYLDEKTKVIDLPVYETVLKKEIPASSANVLIFTSPSNVEAYFAENLLDPSQQVISIGHSTGKVLDRLGVKYSLPYSPDEIGLAEAVFGLDI